MVLTKSELIYSLQNEARILLHLISKVEPEHLDYRPTPKQRSTIELLRYLSMMGPELVEVAKVGTFDPEAWTRAERATDVLTFDEARQAVAGHADTYAALIGGMADEDFRADVEMFGQKGPRGAFMVNSILSGCAAYRTQLFLYLKACGREELSTMDLWAGVDG